MYVYVNVCHLSKADYKIEHSLEKKIQDRARVHLYMSAIVISTNILSLNGWRKDEGARVVV